MVELGHIVYYVRDLEASVAFYTRVVGLNVVGTIFDGRAALLSGGRTHHELLLIGVGEADGPLQGRRIGLYHAGWKIGNSLDELKQARQRILDSGYAIDGQSDHLVSRSLYLRDPDGNEVELFVDNPDVDWHNDRAWMSAPVRPLEL
ncbi:MAG: VOC family protein [Thiohalobacterales bacterium]|nr:VOC family protein [Thiohalobacterales bacterium]